jgi:hypothetical protein
MVPLTAARLKERGESLCAFERAGGRTGRLVWLDEQVREGRRTDWPGRGRGPERRTRPLGQTGPTEPTEAAPGAA